MLEHVGPAFIISFIVAVGIAAQWLSWWLKQPAILLLLVLGVVLGPVLGVLNPDELFGDLLLPAVSLGVAVILFEGSLTLKFSEIRGHGQVVMRLVTTGALVSMLTIAGATWALGLFSWEVALLFGALVSVTGPTVIVPLLRTVRPNKNLANILRWEGILIDPLGALAALIIFQFVALGPEQASDYLLVARILAVGIGIGAVAAFGLAFALRRHVIPDYLHNVVTLATVLLAFSASDALAHESGLLAVTVMGVMLANFKDLDTEEILNFKESLTILLTSVLFIVLAARVPFQSIQLEGWGTVLLLLFILFVARPVSVFASTIGSSLPWAERAVLSWIAPRGIVAAAVSALFALRLEEAGVEGAGTLVQMVFAVIVVTVFVQGITARPFARLMGVADPDARGMLIVGGNPVAHAIAQSLKKLDIEVIVADTSWDQIRHARMTGLRTFFGTVVSDEADRRLDLVGIGMLFALSHRAPLNALACIRYANEFGSANVFNIRIADAVERATKPAGRTLFKDDVTLEKLENLIVNEGFEIRHTRLTDEFDFQQMVEVQSENSILLYAVSPDGAVYPFASDRTFKAGEGWRIAYLDKVEGGTSEEKIKSAGERAKAHISDRLPKPLPS
jgi:NhaP-type Na+/H+ or K+/H+ antiporter